MALPKAVHVVVARGREYFYYQPGRGTPHAGPRIRLPNDPHAPEFWVAIRQAQGLTGQIRADSVNALLDAYLTSPDFLALAPDSQSRYKRDLKIARAAWGELAADGVRPMHVRIVMDELAATPGKANAWLGTMQAVAAFALPRGLMTHNFTDGVKRYKSDGGHKPWTPEQIAAAHALPPSVVRRGIMIYLYTGQRGSDVVRLGPTMVDDGGFALGQKKTKREVWCPILPELASEMVTWERRPGPYLRQASGKPYTRKLFWAHFKEQIAGIEALEGVTLHGLRATATIRLRTHGLSVPQISDITGMSLQTIERYCRFADKKASGQAALISLKEHAKNRIVKH